MATQYTTPFNLPYPQGNDPVKSGHLAIEGIAKGVNTALQNANIPPGNPDLNNVLARLNELENPSTDIPWTTLNLVQGFTHHTTSGWSGLKYRVKDGQVTVTGAVSRTTTWPADFVFAVIPTGLKPSVKVAGNSCEIEPTVGNIVMTTTGVNARSVFVTWPLD